MAYTKKQAQQLAEMLGLSAYQRQDGTWEIE